MDGYPDIRAVADHARGRIGSLSGQAVYDILDAFTEAGLVRRIQPAGGPPSSRRGSAINHHHLICRRGKTIVDDLGQPGSRYRNVPSDLDRTHLATNSIVHLEMGLSAPILAWAIEYWRNVDPNLGAEVAKGVNGG